MLSTVRLDWDSKSVVGSTSESSTRYFVIFSDINIFGVPGEVGESSKDIAYTWSWTGARRAKKIFCFLGKVSVKSERFAIQTVNGTSDRISATPLDMHTFLEAYGLGRASMSLNLPLGK